MKVTIITPTFNSAATLRQNLLSVERQDYKNIEQLIIDNVSSDGTLELVKQFKHNVRVISESDSGIYDAMNKGIMMADGSIVGILNSDDYLSNEGTITQIVEKFKQDNCDAVYGDLIYVKEDNPEKILRVWRAGSFKRNSFMYGWMLPHPTFYVRKEVYDRYGLYNTDLRYSADYEMMLRLLVKFSIKVSNVNEVLVYMQAGGASNKNVSARFSVNREDRMAWLIAGLSPKWYTLYLKPLRKVWQYYLHFVHVSWMVHIPPAHDQQSFLK